MVPLLCCRMLSPFHAFKVAGNKPLVSESSSSGRCLRAALQLSHVYLSYLRLTPTVLSKHFLLYVCPGYVTFCMPLHTHLKERLRRMRTQMGFATNDAAWVVIFLWACKKLTFDIDRHTAKLKFLPSRGMQKSVVGSFRIMSRTRS